MKLLTPGVENPSSDPGQLAPFKPQKGSLPLPGKAGRDLARLFKLLSDETRLRILYYLVQEPELHVRALCERLDQSQPAVSHHLALLREARLVQCRRDGKHNYYRLLPQRFQSICDLPFASCGARLENAAEYSDCVLS